MRKQYVVRLPEEERASLLTMVGRGVAPARAQTHALLVTDHEFVAPTNSRASSPAVKTATVPLSTLRSSDRRLSVHRSS